MVKAEPSQAPLNLLEAKQPNTAVEPLLCFSAEDEGQPVPGPSHHRLDPANPRDLDFFLNLLRDEIKLNPAWEATFDEIMTLKHKQVLIETQSAHKRFAVMIRDIMREKTEWPVGVLSMYSS